MQLRMFVMTVMLLMQSVSISARDFENAYAVYGAGSEPCKHYAMAMKKGGASLDYFNNWVIGYLSAFNVIMPETHNILGEMDFPSAQGWLLRNCNRYPNELFINATARLTEVLYPMRYKSSLKNPPQKETTDSQPATKPKRKFSDIKIR